MLDEESIEDGSCHVGNAPHVALSGRGYVRVCVHYCANHLRKGGRKEGMTEGGREEGKEEVKRAN